jgi:hypothetical protein
MEVHVTTFTILHKLLSIEIYGYCEVIGLDRRTRGEITDPSYSELTTNCQAVSRRPFTAEVRILLQDSSCGICGGQTGVE